MLQITNDAPYLDLQGQSIAEITSDWYYSLLGSVPPLNQSYDTFTCGEPTDHDINFNRLYTNCARYNGKFYALAPASPMCRDEILKKVAQLVQQDEDDSDYLPF